MALLRRELSSAEFKSSRSTCIRYSKQLSLPPGAVTEFVWKDYCAASFRDLQNLGHVDYDDYLMSIRSHDTIMLVFLQGKCGKPFHLPNDNQFVIKTLRKSEVKVLIKMLPSYYNHVKDQGKTLLTKLYGLHAIRAASEGLKVYFVVMENILKADLTIHKQFDLKGSSQGRTTSKVGTYPTSTLKDLDFDFCFYLDSSIRDQLIWQIQRDCKFFEEQGIMDYSLLLGVHIEANHQGSSGEDYGIIEEALLDPPVQGRHKRDPTLADFFDPMDRPGFKFGMKLPARAIKIPRGDKGSVSLSKRLNAEESYNVLLYFGIIDFFQNYNMIKRIEHAYKSIQYNSKAIPSVNPRAYSSRFLDYMCQVFLPEAADS